MNNEAYEDVCELRRKLEALRLTDLLVINPTLQEMRAVNRILEVGYGKSYQHIEHHIKCAEMLLKRLEVK